MKAKIIHISNYKEIDKAIERNESLGIECFPDQVKEYRDIYFNMNDVSIAYVTLEHEILIKTSDEYFCLKYDESIINELESKFNKT